MLIVETQIADSLTIATNESAVMGILSGIEIIPGKNNFVGMCIGTVGGIPAIKVLQSFSMQFQKDGDDFDRTVSVPVGSIAVCSHAKQWEGIPVGALIVAHATQIIAFVKTGPVGDGSRSISI